MAGERESEERHPWPATPTRVTWPPVRIGEVLVFVLAFIGITASWVPSRYREFADLPWWQAGGLVLVYALALAGGWGILRICYVAIRRSHQYPVVYDYSERLERELARSRQHVGRLTEIVSNLVAWQDVGVHTITGAAMHGAFVDLFLVPGQAGSPSVGDLLLLVSSLTGEYLGSCEVTVSREDQVWARIMEADPIWLGFIHDRARQHARLGTTVVAVPLRIRGEIQ